MRNLLRTAGAIVLALLPAGCATRGALHFDCKGFDHYVHNLEPSKLVRDIQSDAVTDVDLLSGDTALASDIDPMANSIAALLAPDGPRSDKDPRSTLLLSGGGQWGAFGAGFLGRLHDQAADPAHADRYPDFGVITGVSTGGLQALFVAIGDAEAYRDLRTHYAPKSEKEIVDRNPTWQAVATGSVAGLAPLRRKIEAVLCHGGDPAKECKVIEQLAASGTKVYIGFVEASSGRFVYADVVAIANDAKAGPTGLESRRNAQQCLTGVAMASAAMPVFFQQVKIGPHAYYDGGVRQSVFEVRVAELMQQASARALEAAAARKRSGDSAPDAATHSSFAEPSLYVVRNGPTILEPDHKADDAADALTAAFRAEAIVVNELEVSSIAALRLARPTGPIRLVTADGWKKSSPVCDKPPGVMFDPDFMACLQTFGIAKASRPVPWISLREITGVRKKQ